MIKPIALLVAFIFTTTAVAQSVTATQADSEQAPVRRAPSPLIVEIPITAAGPLDPGGLADFECRGIWIRGVSVEVVEKKNRYAVQFYGWVVTRYGLLRHVTIHASILKDGRVLTAERWMKNTPVGYNNGGAVRGMLRVPKQDGLVLKVEIFAEDGKRDDRAFTPVSSD